MWFEIPILRIMAIKAKIAPFLLCSIFCLPVKADSFSIAYASAWNPISHGNGEKVKGILPSLADLIIKGEMGLPVKHIGMPWKRAQESIRTGSADAFITTPTAARLAFTEGTKESFYVLEFRAFAPKGSDAHMLLQSKPDVSDHKETIRFCDVLGNGWAEAFYRSKDTPYFVAPEIEQCLRMISRDRQDVVIHSTDVTVSKLDELDLSNEIIQLPQVYHQVEFTLMISKASPFYGKVIESIDAKLKELKANGKYQALLKKAQGFSHN